MGHRRQQRVKPSASYCGGGGEGGGGRGDGEGGGGGRGGLRRDERMERHGGRCMVGISGCCVTLQSAPSFPGGFQDNMQQ